MNTIAGRMGQAVIGALLIQSVVVPARADGPPNLSVLAVGINDYKSNRFSDLRGAVNDARSIAGLFREQGPRARVRELLDWDATHNNVVAALAQLEAGIEPGEVAVIFLSGHGGRFADDWEFLCQDSDPPTPGATLSGVWLLNAARRLVDRGHIVILAIDACQAGQVAQSDGVEGVMLSRGPAQGGLILMASCSATQSSKDGPDNGFFTKALLEALRGAADLDESGAVSFKETELYLRWRLRQLNRGIPKYPGIAWPEQDALCASSFRVPERLAITKTRGQKPTLPSAADPLRAPFAGIGEQPNLPVGIWREVKTHVIPGGADLQPVYTLEIHADGTYAAYFKNPLGSVESGTGGRYQAASLGFRATLAYENGYDTVIVDRTGPNAMEITTYPSKSTQSQPGKLLLRRVEEPKDAP